MKLKFNTAIFFILLLALLLRLPLLNSSFWLDEAAQAIESTRPLNQQLNIAHDFQPPLLHLILHFASFFNHSEWWLRTVGALIPGLITILFTIKISQKTFSLPGNSQTNSKINKISLIAGLLLATNSFHLFYSQELRPYSLPAMWTVLSWWQIINIYQKRNKKNCNLLKPKKTNSFSKPWLFFILFSILGLYSSYLYPFILIGQFLFLSTKKFKALILAGLTIVLFYLPWLPSFFNQLKIGQQLRIQMPHWESVVSINQLKSLPLIFGKFFYGNLSLDLNLIYLVLPIFVGILIFFNLFIHRKKIFKNYPFAINVLTFWLIIPLITAWLVSFIIPVLRPKRVLVLLPAFEIFLTGSLLLFSIQNLSAKNLDKPKKTNSFLSKLSIKAVIILLLINLISTYSYYTQPQLQRENWRDLTAEIQNKFKPSQTAVIFSFENQFAPWQWYAQDNYPTLATGTYLLTDKNQIKSSLKNFYQYEYLLLFDYLRDLTDPDNLLPTVLKDYGYQEVGVLNYPNIGFVRIYSRNSKTSYLKKLHNSC